MVTVEYSQGFYPDIDHVKFRATGWVPETSSFNAIILKHESDGWYLRDTHLTDANWSAQVNEEFHKNEPNYIVLAIHPDDPFKAAVEAADRCRAMRTDGTLEYIVIFQCRFD